MYRIFDAHVGETIPEGYNAVKIILNGRVRSPLDWKIAERQAQAYIEKGYKIFWELSLGLFSGLEFPLSNQMQFLALGLSLEHFLERIWNRFPQDTVGICLYRGNVDFRGDLPWNEEQDDNFAAWLKEHGFDPNGENHNELLSLFCRDAASEYLELLANRLPETIETYALFNATGVKSSLQLAQLTGMESYRRIRPIVKGGLFSVSGWRWEGDYNAGYFGRGSFNRLADATTIGVTLPSTSLALSHREELEKLFHWLSSLNVPFRVIPEELLTAEWDGLDHLLVVSSAVATQGRRKLQGFCAAGGVVVTVGDLLGLPNEESFCEIDSQKIIDNLLTTKLFK